MLSIFRKKPRFEMHLALIHQKKETIALDGNKIEDAKRAAVDIIHRYMEDTDSKLPIEVIKKGSYIRDTKDGAKYHIRATPNNKTVCLCRYW